MIIKGLTKERMQRLIRFTDLLNAKLITLGGEPLDLLEAHGEYQLQVDRHHGPWDDLVATIAGERTAISYSAVDWDGDNPPDEIDED
jgi:hypothetical protein